MRRGGHIMNAATLQPAPPPPAGGTPPPSGHPPIRGAGERRHKYWYVAEELQALQSAEADFVAGGHAAGSYCPSGVQCPPEAVCPAGANGYPTPNDSPTLADGPHPGSQLLATRRPAGTRQSGRGDRWVTLRREDTAPNRG